MTAIYPSSVFSSGKGVRLVDAWFTLRVHFPTRAADIPPAAIITKKKHYARLSYYNYPIQIIYIDIFLFGKHDLATISLDKSLIYQRV